MLHDRFITLKSFDIVELWYKKLFEVVQILLLHDVLCIPNGLLNHMSRYFSRQTAGETTVIVFDFNWLPRSSTDQFCNQIC